MRFRALDVLTWNDPCLTLSTNRSVVFYENDNFEKIVTRLSSARGLAQIVQHHKFPTYNDVSD